MTIEEYLRELKARDIIIHSVHQYGTKDWTVRLGSVDGRAFGFTGKGQTFVAAMDDAFRNAVPDWRQMHLPGVLG